MKKKWSLILTDIKVSNVIQNFKNNSNILLWLKHEVGEYLHVEITVEEEWGKVTDKYFYQRKHLKVNTSSAWGRNVRLPR